MIKFIARCWVGEDGFLFLLQIYTCLMHIKQMTYIILLATLATGCAIRYDLNAMQPHAEGRCPPPVYGTHTIGQSFVASRRNLVWYGIDVG